MRVWWLVAIAGCVSEPMAPEPVAPAPPVATRAKRIVPEGAYVADLLAHRISSEPALGECVDEACPRQVRVRRVAGAPRSIVVAGRRATPAALVGNTAPELTSAEPITIELCIDETGVVTSARTSQTSPAAEAALERARAWRFRPYFLRGKPIAVCSFVPAD